MEADTRSSGLKSSKKKSEEENESSKTENNEFDSCIDPHGIKTEILSDEEIEHTRENAESVLKTKNEALKNAQTQTRNQRDISERIGIPGNVSITFEHPRPVSVVQKTKINQQPVLIVQKLPSDRPNASPRPIVKIVSSDSVEKTHKISPSSLIRPFGRKILPSLLKVETNDMTSATVPVTEYNEKKQKKANMVVYCPRPVFLVKNKSFVENEKQIHKNSKNHQLLDNKDSVNDAMLTSDSENQIVLNSIKKEPEEIQSDISEPSLTGVEKKKHEELCSGQMEKEFETNIVNDSDAANCESEVLKSGATTQPKSSLKPNRIVESSQQSAIKRKLVGHPVHKKYEAIIEVERGIKSKTEIARQFGVPLNTLSTWLKNADKIVTNFMANYINPRRKRLRPSQYEDIDNALLKWFRSVRDLNIPLSGPVMRAKAEDFATSLGETEFKCSIGWLERFKIRHGISFKKVGGETEYVQDNSDEMSARSPESEVLKSGVTTQPKSPLKSIRLVGSSKPQSAVKRKVVVQPVQKKYEAIMEVERGVKSKTEIARQFGVPLNTLSTWLKNADKIKTSFTSSYNNPGRKRLRPSPYENVDNALFKWYTTVRDLNMPLSSTLMRAKAEDFAASLGETEFKCSLGWLERFRNRRGISFKKVCED